VDIDYKYLEYLMDIIEGKIILTDDLKRIVIKQGRKRIKNECLLNQRKCAKLEKPEK